ncbi:Transformation/transcription domain-associated protein [Oopsacas minuta]|uniref:Transformation/transcription domain-associated protein n=1 Tax=Oopsacas minuta TaxID=111878 RepID=A0AAV7JCS3_9METZ|nr:Transformation/transcription domain-associated protein [Oopsacas minuta]
MSQLQGSNQSPNALNLLVDTSENFENKLKCIQDTIESLDDTIHSDQYNTFLHNNIPIFFQFLRETEIQFTSDTPQQEARKQIINILYRLPTNDSLKPYSNDILHKVFNLIVNDNEDNAVICVWLIIEHIKYYKPQLSSELQQFLHFTKKVLADLPNLKDELLNYETRIQESNEPSQIAEESKSDVNASRQLTRVYPSHLSLKVLAELPVVLLLAYQCYKPTIEPFIIELIPQLIIAIKLDSQAYIPEPNSKDILIDFISTQVKYVSFLSFFSRSCPEKLTEHATNLVHGVIQMLQNLPSEVILVRKELINATKSLILSDLRVYFLVHVEVLLEERIFLGPNSYEGFRTLYYQCIGDLVYHLKSKLSIFQLRKAVDLFGRAMYEPSYPTLIHQVSVKVMLGLAECLRQKQDEASNRDLLIRMLNMLLLKFQFISEQIVPQLFEQCSGDVTRSTSEAGPSLSISEDKRDDYNEDFSFTSTKRFANKYSVPGYILLSESKSLLKLFVLSVKAIVTALTIQSGSHSFVSIASLKSFPSYEEGVFHNLFESMLRSLELYRLSSTSSGALIIANPKYYLAAVFVTKVKEEKEVFENFAHIFTTLTPSTFKCIISTHINLLIEQIQKNFALQFIPQTFYTQPSTCAIFSSIMLDFLVKRLEEMGSNPNKSELYLKLLKLTFSSIAYFPQENEQLLKPYISPIISKSLTYCKSATDPMGYFYLIKALYRGLGNASEATYNEFRFQLTDLLSTLNKFHSTAQTQHLRDIIVELSLTIPFRSFTIALPYAPYIIYLMRPLVSALDSSSPNYIQMGLKFLDAFLDIVAPNKLFDTFHNLKAPLMCSLYRNLASPDKEISRAVFKILGKFGGNSRNVLKIPQELCYLEPEVCEQHAVLSFSNIPGIVTLPVAKLVQESTQILEEGKLESNYLEAAWHIIHGYLLSIVNSEEIQFVNNITKNSKFVLRNKTHKHTDIITHIFIKEHDHTLNTALFGLLNAVYVLKGESVQFFQCLVQHISLMHLITESFPSEIECGMKSSFLLTSLTQAIVRCLCAFDDNLIKLGKQTILLILETIMPLLNEKEQFSELGFFEELAHNLTICCYKLVWFEKRGACVGIEMLTERLSTKWVIQHQVLFLKGLFNLIGSLDEEITYGIIQLASQLVYSVIDRCNSPLSATELSITELQQQYQECVVELLTREICSPNKYLRKIVFRSLNLLSLIIPNTTVTTLLITHKQIIHEYFSFQESPLRILPKSVQIGFLDGFYFCSSQNPRVYSIDTTNILHNTFINDLFVLCDCEELVVNKPQKTDIVNQELIKSGLYALTVLCYYPGLRENIFKILCKFIRHGNPDLMEDAKTCMQMFLQDHHDQKLAHDGLRGFLNSILRVHASLTPPLLQRLTCMISLFPASFNEKFCNQLLNPITNHLSSLLSTQNRGHQVELEKTILIINMFHYLPAATFKHFETIVTAVLQLDRLFSGELDRNLYDAVTKFALSFPERTMKMFIDCLPSNPDCFKLFSFLITQKNSLAFLNYLKDCRDDILCFMQMKSMYNCSEEHLKHFHDLTRYYGYFICDCITQQDPSWITEQLAIISFMKAVWKSDNFHQEIDTFNNSPLIWKIPKLLSQCLVAYLNETPEDTDTLFYLLRAYDHKYLCSMEALKTFIDYKVVVNYSCQKKRAIFFAFVPLYRDTTIDNAFKCKVCTHILIPMIRSSFEDGQVDEIIGGLPCPDEDSETNIISVFIGTFIDCDNSMVEPDNIRLILLQFACLFVEYGFLHIHDPTTRKHGTKLRQLMTYAWPCLHMKRFAEPSMKYHGHLLLAHIISKFAIHRKIVIQVFNSLLESHTGEVIGVAKKALDIIVPALPNRMEDGQTLLLHWTRKVLVEESKSGIMMHVILIIIQHNQLYYPIYRSIIHYMIAAMQKISSGMPSKENRKICLDIAEVVLKWELLRAKDEKNSREGGTVSGEQYGATGMEIDQYDNSNKFNTDYQTIEGVEHEKFYLEFVMNYLFKFVCYRGEHGITGPQNQWANEPLWKRCLNLFKRAIMQPEISRNVTIKTQWLEKLFSVPLNEQNATLYIRTIHSTLELVANIIDKVPFKSVVTILQPISKCITKCLTSSYSKIIQGIHVFYSKLLLAFPPSSNQPSFELINSIYSNFNDFIKETLSGFEKNPHSMNMYTALLLCNTTTGSNHQFAETFLSIIVRILQKIIKDQYSVSGEATTPAQEGNNSEIASQDIINQILNLIFQILDQLILSMSGETRRLVLNSVIMICENSQAEALIVKALEHTKLIVFSTDSSIVGPCWKEKSQNLQRMKCVTNRFNKNHTIADAYFDIIFDIYNSQDLRGSQVATDLEVLFLHGMKSEFPLIRQKFFNLYQSNLGATVYDRLINILIGQNWKNFGQYYWIKHCVHIVLSVINQTALLETCVLVQDGYQQGPLQSQFRFKASFKGDMNFAQSPPSSEESPLLESIKENYTSNFVNAIAELCYLNTQFCHWTWIHLFPMIWEAFNQKDRNTLSSEISPFLLSGIHLFQAANSVSALGTFLEAVSLSNPTLQMRPPVLHYLGKTHNTHYRAIICLESFMNTNGGLQHISKDPKSIYVGTYEDELLEPLKIESIECLSHLYLLVNEEDLWAGLWRNHSLFPDTISAVSFESQGFYEEAQRCYEQAMGKAVGVHNNANAPPSIIPEYKLWEKQWIRCSKELGQWDLLNDFGTSQGVAGKPLTILHSAWRLADWNAVKEAVNQLEMWNFEDDVIDINIHKCYLSLCQDNTSNPTEIKTYVDTITDNAMRKFQKLPRVIGPIHISLLRLSHKVVEVNEASQILTSLQQVNNVGPQALADLKVIPKNWRDRLPNKFDDLSYWSDILNLRQHMFKAIVSNCEGFTQTMSDQHSPTLTAFHNSAFSFVKYASIARKQDLVNVCLDALVRIMSIPQVQPQDKFVKQKEKIKCYIKIAHIMNESELQEAVENISATDVTTFTSQSKSDFFSYKAVLLSHIGRAEDANNMFSAAIQLYDDNTNAWGMWGEYMDKLFMQQGDENRISYAKSAMASYMQSCRQSKVSTKTSLFISRIFWLLLYEEEGRGNLDEVFQNFASGIAVKQWISWIEQIIKTSFLKNKHFMLDLLIEVAKVYPQSVYFHSRAAYLSLQPHLDTLMNPTLSTNPSGSGDVSLSTHTDVKTNEQNNETQPCSSTDTLVNNVAMDEQEELNLESSTIADVSMPSEDNAIPINTPYTPNSHPYPPPPPNLNTPITQMQAITSRLEKVNLTILLKHPANYFSLNAFADAMTIGIHWESYLLTILGDLLLSFKKLAFENTSTLMTAKLTQGQDNTINTLISIFKQGIDCNELPVGAMRNFSAKLKEELDLSIGDNQQLKSNFLNDFTPLSSQSIPQANIVHRAIANIRKWITILSDRQKAQTLIPFETSMYNVLSNFTSSTTNLSLPGLPPNLDMPGNTVIVERFLHNYDTVVNSPGISLAILGHDGNIYTYKLEVYISPTDCNRVERINELLDRLNPYIDKTKETAKRYLKYHRPYWAKIAPCVSLLQISNNNTTTLNAIFNKFTKANNLPKEPYFNQYYECVMKDSAKIASEGDLYYENLFSEIQRNFCPKHILKEWAKKRFSNPTDYWTFRRQFTNYLSVNNITQYALCLTSITPENLEITCNTGSFFVSKQTFDLDTKHTPPNLHYSHNIPFRLTPNITHFINDYNISGPMLSNMIAIIRCYAQPKFGITNLLCVYIYNELMDYYIQQKSVEFLSSDRISMELFSQVTQSVTFLVNRISNLANFNDAKSPIENLIIESQEVARLAIVCPTWISWL